MKNDSQYRTIRQEVYEVLYSIAIGEPGEAKATDEFIASELVAGAEVAYNEEDKLCFLAGSDEEQERAETAARAAAALVMKSAVKLAKGRAYELVYARASGGQLLVAAQFLA